MQTKFPVAALLFGAVLIALIAGVTGWSMRSRTIPANAESVRDPEGDPLPATPLKSDPEGFRRSSIRLSQLPTQPRILDNARQISEMAALGRKKLKTRFDSEPVDQAWASRKESALAAANDAKQITELGAKPLAFDSRCRASVCLIGADFPSVTAADDWFNLYTLVAGPEMSRAAVQRSNNPDGTIHLQVYGLARGNQF